MFASFSMKIRFNKYLILKYLILKKTSIVPNSLFCWPLPSIRPIAMAYFLRVVLAWCLKIRIAVLYKLILPPRPIRPSLVADCLFSLCVIFACFNRPFPFSLEHLTQPASAPKRTPKGLSKNGGLFFWASLFLPRFQSTGHNRRMGNGARTVWNTGKDIV